MLETTSHLAAKMLIIFNLTRTGYELLFPLYQQVVSIQKL